MYEKNRKEGEKMENNHNTIAHIASIIMFIIAGIITLYLFSFLTKMGGTDTEIAFVDNIGDRVMRMGAFLLFVLDTFSLGLILRILSQGYTANYNHTNGLSDSNERTIVSQNKPKVSNDDRLKI